MDNKESGKRSRVFVILLLLLLIIAAWLLYTEKNTSENLKQDKDILQEELAEMVGQYEAVLSDRDSLDAEIIAERDRILALRDSVSMLTDNVKLLERYRSEVRRIRRERKDLLARADSLLTANQQLQVEKELLSDTLSAERTANEQLSSVNKQLQRKIKAGAILEAQAISAMGIKLRSNGSEKPMDKASRVEKFKTCFTIGKNMLSEKGNKWVYLRVINPDGDVEQGSNAEGTMITLANEKTISVSERKQVYYENAPIDMCIYVDSPEEAMVGTYQVEIYCEGHIIGKTSFVLEESIF